MPLALTGSGKTTEIARIALMLLDEYSARGFRSDDADFRQPFPLQIAGSVGTAAANLGAPTLHGLLSWQPLPEGLTKACSEGAACSLSSACPEQRDRSPPRRSCSPLLCKSAGAGPDSKEVQEFLDTNLTGCVRKVLSALRHLVVTEAHRLEEAMWIALDAALQRATGIKCKWGGVQLVLEGDFLQLTSGTPLFKQADFARSFKVVYLKQQWRSHGDLQDLLGVMAMARCGSLPPDVPTRLRSLARSLAPALDATAVHLFGKTKDNREFNERMNLQLPGPTVVYKGTDSSGEGESRNGTDVEAALDASTNLRSSPLPLKVRCSTHSPVRRACSVPAAFLERRACGVP